MNFLQLCQRVAQESGTVSDLTRPTTVVGQAGRLKRIVDWTATAFTDIQNEEEAWRFLRKDLPATAVTQSGTARYTSSSWNISDWGEWITEPDSVSVYLSATGVSDESRIRRLEWDRWRMAYDMGTQDTNRPVHYSISPAGEFCLGPTPDATYVVNGEYRRAPQELSGNTDTPIIPSRFHMIIVWRALVTLAQFDEFQFHVATAQSNYLKMLDDLQRDQLPRVIIGSGPIA